MEIEKNRRCKDVTLLNRDTNACLGERYLTIEEQILIGRGNQGQAQIESDQQHEGQGCPRHAGGIVDRIGETMQTRPLCFTHTDFP